MSGTDLNLPDLDLPDGSEKTLPTDPDVPMPKYGNITIGEGATLIIPENIVHLEADNISIHGKGKILQRGDSLTVRVAGVLAGSLGVTTPPVTPASTWCFSGEEGVSRPEAKAGSVGGQGKTGADGTRTTYAEEGGTGHPGKTDAKPGETGGLVTKAVTSKLKRRRFMVAFCSTDRAAKEVKAVGVAVVARVALVARVEWDGLTSSALGRKTVALVAPAESVRLAQKVATAVMGVEVAR